MSDALDMEAAFIIVVFLIGAACATWWGRNRRSNLADGLAAAAPTVGLTMHADPDSERWLAEAPNFRLLASGTAKRLLSRGTLDDGAEVMIYNKGSQTTSGRSDAFVIYAERVDSPTASFSLVPSDPLDSRRRDEAITLTPLPGWDQLGDRSLWMHADPARPTADAAIPQDVLVQCSHELENGIRSRVEYVGGLLLHYLLVSAEFTPDEIASLVARGRAYAGLLRAG